MRRIATAGGRGVFALVLTAVWPLVPAAASALCDQPGWSPRELRTSAAEPVPEGRRGILHGVVSGRFLSEPGLDGFFVQSADERGIATGMFVYAPDIDHDGVPERGRRVAMQGQTGRYRGQAQFERIRAVGDCGATLLEPVRLALPLTNAQAEPLAGVLVTVAPEQGLAVTGNTDLARYGSLDLAMGERLFHARSGVPGGTPAGVLLDDGAYRRDPQPIPYLDTNGTRRLGDRIGSITGVLAHAFGAWRLHPVEPVAFRSANPRPRAPVRSGRVRVIGYNVGNWFTTLGSRGADTDTEQRRQARQLNALVKALDPDVLALQEVENRPRAMAELLRILNRDHALDTVFEAASAGLDPGSGVIRNTIVYRRDRLRLEDATVLEDGVHNRAPLAAAFRTDDGTGFAVATFHAKSKGGCRAGMPRLPDGGCWADRRLRQARSLAAWRGVLSRRFGHDRLLMLGDLNSQPLEPPAAAMVSTGLVDAISRKSPPKRRYSYVYEGHAGLVDHAYATASLWSLLATAGPWPINADEPRGVPRVADAPWGASDHDPLIVELFPLGQR